MAMVVTQSYYFHKRLLFIKIIAPGKEQPYFLKFIFRFYLRLFYFIFFQLTQ